MKTLVLLLGVCSVVFGGEDSDEMPLPETPGDDGHEACCFWAGLGECDSNPYWMRVVCQRSCGTTDCDVAGAEDCEVTVNLEGCPWPEGAGEEGTATEEDSNEDSGESESEESADSEESEEKSGEEEETGGEGGGESSEGAEDAPPGTDGSGSDDDMPIPASPGDDGHEACCFWAGLGECDSNPYWMRPVCQASCGTTDCDVASAEECEVSVNLEGCPWK